MAASKSTERSQSSSRSNYIQYYDLPSSNAIAAPSSIRRGLIIWLTISIPRRFRGGGTALFLTNQSDLGIIQRQEYTRSGRMQMSRSVVLILTMSIMVGMIIQCTDRNPVSPRSGQRPGPGADRAWYQQNPYPTSNTLTDVQFIGDYEAWAVGTGATLWHTTDGGKSWRGHPGLPATASGLCFIDNQRGWAVGGHGMIMRTDDGGRFWVEQESGTEAYLNAVSFINDRQGWAVGSSGTILHTGDGGKTWEPQGDSDAYWLYDVLFIDNQTGWAVGTNSAYETGAEILHTQDGGTTWNHIDAGIPVDLGVPDSFLTASLYAIAALDEETIVIVGESNQWQTIGGIRLYTNDGGENWNVELTNATHHDVEFLADGSAWIVGYAGTMYRSTDGGVSWNRIGQPGGWSLLAVTFSNAQYGCAVGSTGTIWITSNGGNNWTKVTRGSRSDVLDIQFTDPDHGWVAGFGGVLRTTDGGQTWEQTECSASSTLWFLDSQNGWACDYQGNLDRTYDGGITWSRTRDAVESRVYDMVFIDSLHGWVSGMPAILRTDDGGFNWTVQWAGGGWLWGITFVDTLHGWAVGDNSTILHTDNGGRSWQQQTAPVVAGLKDVFFVDTLRGWAVGGSSAILATTDGGNNWVLQSNTGLPALPALYSVVFVDSQTGWTAGDHGFVLHTTDGGQSWVEQSTPTSSLLFGLWAVDSLNVWAGGWGGTIIHTSSGGW